MKNRALVFFVALLLAAFSNLAHAAAATHFLVTAPGTATANSSFTFTVQALDGTNAIDTTYAGTVSFTSSDPAAILPASSTLVNGVRTFSATLYTGGNTTIGANDGGGSGGVSGVSGSIVVAAPAYFSVTAPPNATANIPFTFTVQALDQFFNPIAYYPGPIRFLTTDGLGVVPAMTTMPTGFGTFSATLYTGGPQLISADDNGSGSGSVNGTSSTITVAAPAHFIVTAPLNATANIPFTFTVQAVDQFFIPIAYYPGPIRFLTTDGLAVLPAMTTMPTGFGTFSATLYTGGPQLISADDNGSGTGSVNGTSSTITVAAPAHFIVTAPLTATANVPFTFTVQAVDQFFIPIAYYPGPIRFLTTDGLAVLPAITTMPTGFGTFSATLNTLGSQVISADDNGSGTGSVNGVSSPITVAPAVATHFSVTAPASVTAGVAASFTVTARDATNAVVPGYSGTVHFTSTDGQAVLPANSTLVAGVGTFSATLKTAGNQAITATDTVTASITGTSGSIAVSPAAATHFAVTAPPAATGNVAFNFTVTALDAFNNTATGYAGGVHFTSSDGLATLPADSPLASGIGTFPATLRTAGARTITATDTLSAAITGTSGAITVTAAAATHFTVSAPASASPGAAFTVTVTALDAGNAVATGYTGTVHFTSSDGTATLPANMTLTNGVGTFSAILNTTGNQTISATDTVSAGITGTSAAIAVGAGTATRFTITAPATVIAGTPFSFTVTAFDASNNVATGYAGTALFTANDATPTLPAGSTLINGVRTFTATLRTVGTRTITATDTSAPSITGDSATITVSPGPVARLAVGVSPTTVANGDAFPVSVTAFDAFNNTVTTYAGTVHFTSTDPAATLPADTTLTSGFGFFPATLRTQGTQTITATDTANASITGTSPTLTVGAPPITTFSGASPTGTGTITASFTGGGPTCTFVSPQFIPLIGHARSPPAGSAPVAFPHGLFDFSTTGCIQGATLTFTITYPAPLPAGTQYWKYGPTSGLPAHWYVLPANISGAVVTFSIADGGLGDDDLVVNGIIVDQGGPGAPPGASGAGAAIPTLSEWAMMLLALIVGGFGWRRRHA